MLPALKRQVLLSGDANHANEIMRIKLSEIKSTYDTQRGVRAREVLCNYFPFHTQIVQITAKELKVERGMSPVPSSFFPLPCQSLLTF
jgi:hypothetical protein